MRTVRRSKCVCTRLRQRGQVSALYLFTTNAIGQGLGSTAVAFSTDFVFQRDEAVGLSIALVAVVASFLGFAKLPRGAVVPVEETSSSAAV